MKNTYKIILMGFVVLGIVYTNAEPDWKKNKDEKYKSFDICKFPVSIDIDHYIQIKECHKRKIELKQVHCEDIGRGGGDFPCYKGSDTFAVRANFPAVFTASIDTSADDKDMIQEVNLYFENDVNSIKGTGEWEKLTLCLETWDFEIWKSAGVIGDVEIGDITIQVKCPKEAKDEYKDDTTKNEEKSEDKAWKDKPIDLCKFTVSIDIGHYVQLKECHKRKIELIQVDCEEIGKDHRSFPCYKGSDVIEVRANFPAIFDASINKNCENGDLLPEVNLYFENDVNSIKGTTGGWEKLKLCLEVCNIDYNNMPAPGKIEVGEIIIGVRPPDDLEDDTEDSNKDETEDDTGNS